MKKISALIAIAAMAAFSAHAQVVTTVEPTVSAGVAHIHGGAAMSPSFEGGVKVTRNKVVGTVGLGTVFSPEWAGGSHQNGVFSVSYQYAPKLAFGVGSFVNATDGSYAYTPFVQVTSAIDKHDLVMRVATKDQKNVTQVMGVYKF